MKKDVVAVDLETNKIRWVHTSNTDRDANAVVSMAVMRQGVEDQFITVVKHGKYKAGDTYKEKK